jgi:hypothetical protein
MIDESRMIMSLRWRPWTAGLALGLLTAVPAWAQTEEDSLAEEAPTVEDQTPGEQAGDPAGIDSETGTDETVDGGFEAADPDSVDEFDDEGIDEDDSVQIPQRMDIPAATIATSPAFPAGAPAVGVRSNAERGLGWRLSFGGYIRMRYTAIEADPQVEFFGRNDGFVMADARLTTIGELDNGLGFVLEFDAASPVVASEPGSPVRELTLRMTDTYAFYTPLPFLEFNIGQFKAPFDAEELLSNSDLLFIDRSVGNRGVQGVEGYNVDGLAFGREMGVRAQGAYFFQADPGVFEGPGFSYAMAATNGNGANQSINNNSNLAYYARGSFHWGEYVALGGAYMINDDTLGQPPNRVDRFLRSWTADVQASLYGATLLASVINRRTIAPDLPQEPEVESLAYQLQLGYQEPFIGLQPAYRFAYYDPTHRYPGDELPEFEGDALTYHTIGLNYNAPTYPIRIMANYTITLEEERRQLDNNRFDLLLQLEW